MFLFHIASGRGKCNLSHVTRSFRSRLVYDEIVRNMYNTLRTVTIRSQEAYKVQKAYRSVQKITEVGPTSRICVPTPLLHSLLRVHICTHCSEVTCSLHHVRHVISANSKVPPEEKRIFVRDVSEEEGMCAHDRRLFRVPNLLS
jgi:hypothetical protein